MARNYTFNAGQIQDPQPWKTTIVETSAVVYLRREKPDADMAIPLPELVYRLGDPAQRAAIALLGVTYDHLNVDVSSEHNNYLQVAFIRFIDQPERDYDKDRELSKNLVTYLMHWARELLREEYRPGNPPVFLDEDRMDSIIQEMKVRAEMEYVRRQQYMGEPSLTDLMYREQQYNNMLNRYGAERLSAKPTEFTETNYFTEIFKSMPGKKT